MRILTRYLLLECCVFFAISLFAFTGILLTIQMLKFSDLIINRGVEAHQIALVFLSITPTFMELAIPMATLLGIMLAFARLSGDSEIVVLRSSGVSIYQMIFPVAILAVTLAAVGIEVSTQLKPWGYRTLSEVLFDIAKSRSTAGLEEGVFNKLGNLTLYSQTVSYANGGLQGVLVDDRRDATARKIIFARSGTIAPDVTAQTITINLNEGSMHERVNGRYVITNFVTNNVVMNPDDLYGNQSEKQRGPREMYLSELRTEIPKFEEFKRSLEALELNTPNPDGTPRTMQVLGEEMTLKQVVKKERRLRLEEAMRFSMPYAAFVLAFIAMPLGIQPPRTQRTWGPTVAFILGLLVFVFYYGMLSLGISFVDSGKLSPFVAAWLPNIATTAAAAAMLYGVASEKVQSIPQVFEQWLSAIARSLPQRHKEQR